MYFNNICKKIEKDFKILGNTVNHNKWQTLDVSQNPDMVHIELLNYLVQYELSEESLQFYRDDLKPNLPWADDHFELERVSGEPINPGHQWKNWPYSGSAEQHIDKQFSHSYAERYWPKYAGKTNGGRIQYSKNLNVLHGVRFDYGDLSDLIQVLVKDPYTRQAYLPVWFPEDLTAARLDKRVPCSLGYHFIIRDGLLHVVYPIRSCDYVRHFRDDVYLTVRLLLWVLSQLRIQDPQFANIKPGYLTMPITSFHMFKSDFNIICQG